MSRAPQPMQPIVLAADNVVRFQANLLVKYLLEWASARGCSLNELALLPGIPPEDHEQLAQLIGYSVSGFGDLSYTSPSTMRRADRAAAKILKAGRSAP